MSKLVLLTFLAYIGWLWLNDARRREGISPAVWSVVAWLTLLGSRPVSTWFDFGGGMGSAQAYDEGNPLERMVYFVLIAHGLIVLARRGVKLGEIVAANAWLFVFFLFWALSILWADAPFVAFKRWVKDLGNIVVVLVVLTDRRPLEAMQAVFVRTACLLLPMSVLFVKFIPDLGRTYHVWSGEMMYTGVTTHKNSLGVLVLVSLLSLCWELARRPAPGEPRAGFVTRLGDLSLVAMGAWLLVKAGSATATSSFFIGIGLMVALGWKPLRRHVRAVELVSLVGGLLLWATGAGHRLVQWVIVDLLGRDLTLTTRTDVWPMLLGKVDNVFVGSGFNSFWTGERLDEVYRQLGIIQAHNGYLETYLNGGLVGVALLLILLLAAVGVANRRLTEHAPHANLVFAWVAISVVYNFTEASFDKTSPLWFAFLMMITQYARGHELAAPDVATLPHPASGASGAPADGRLPVQQPW
jgi:exopolysaccharide production protein ExoQ